MLMLLTKFAFLSTGTGTYCRAGAAPFGAGSDFSTLLTINLMRHFVCLTFLCVFSVF